MLLPPYNRRCKGGASVWADATQGMASSAAAVGQRRADAGRAAAQARKMWHLLRARLRGDVSGALGCCCFVCLLLSRFCLEGDCMLCCLLVSMCMPAGCRGSSQRHRTIFGLDSGRGPPAAADAVPAVLQELLPPLWRTEMPLVRVIVDMEAAGLGINEAILNTGKLPGGHPRTLSSWYRSLLLFVPHRPAGEPLPRDCCFAVVSIRPLLFNPL